MLTAEASNLVGCASGFPVRGDGSGWLGFDGALPLAVGRLTGADFAFAFTGTLVHLHARHQASLGVTFADRADQPVPAALRCRGWKDAGDVRRPADGAVFLALVLPVGVRTAARPAGLDHHARTRWSP